MRFEQSSSPHSSRRSRLQASPTSCGLSLSVEWDRDRNCNSAHSTFYTSYSPYNVDACDGCPGTNVPSMTESCLDWSRDVLYLLSMKIKDAL
ncbi:hypothetical protein CTA1_909 [Colletotrichum tanaceti]|uniref:Uncharacterized protein n=1 Tax=Colletotrichum tanaceti TaxID=1306861 RepID=A0A4U6XTG1_9PEZI|nr:hypothetical protein CTA1_909 [Colletotrichum tanaceti]